MPCHSWRWRNPPFRLWTKTNHGFQKPLPQLLKLLCRIVRLLRCLPCLVGAKDLRHLEWIVPSARALRAQTAEVLPILNALTVLVVNGAGHPQRKIKLASQKLRPQLPLATPRKGIHPPIPSARRQLHAGRGLRHARLKLPAHPRQAVARHPRLVTHPQPAPAPLGLVPCLEKDLPIRKSGVILPCPPPPQLRVLRCLPHPPRLKCPVNQNPQNGPKAGGVLRVAGGQDSQDNLKVAGVLNKLRVANGLDNVTDVDGLDKLIGLKEEDVLNALPPRSPLHRRLPACSKMSQSVTARPMLPRRVRSKTRMMPSACS